MRKMFNMHMEALFATRGSSSFPYVYDGKRDIYREGKVGSALNPNHSHYLFVDDESEGKFGRATSIRSDLLEVRSQATRRCL